VSRAVIALAGVVLVALASGQAHADRADQLFKKGKRLLAEKRYAEACSAFEDSDRLDPGIGAKLNVARCYQEWGKLATAWRWFSDAETMAKEAKDDRAVKIHGLIEELDPSVPRLTIKAPRDADTAGIVVKLDGVDLDVAGLGAERRVDPGPHQIEYVIAGARQSKTIPAERGASSEVTLDLPRAAAAARKRRASEPAVEAAGDAGRTRRLAGLGVSAAGVVALGVASVVAIGARSDYRNAIASKCRGAADMCDADGVTATHDARHRANIATLVSIGGAAAIAGGLVLYFTAPRGGAPSTEHALYLAPSVGSDGGGVVFGGAF